MKIGFEFDQFMMMALDGLARKSEIETRSDFNTPSPFSSKMIGLFGSSAYPNWI